MNKLKQFVPRAKTALRSLFSTGFFHIVGSSTINKAITFLYGIILVRLISKPEYGVYTYANNIFGFFMMVCGFGMPSALLQLCSEKSDEKQSESIYRFGCTWGSAFNLLLAAAILVVSLFVPLRIEGSNRLLLMMCLLPFVQYFFEIESVFLRTKMLAKSYSYANTTSSVLHLLLACALAWLFKAEGLIASAYLTAFCMLAVMAFVFHVKPAFWRKEDSISREDRTALLKISGISMVNNGLTRLMMLLDIFILGLIISSDVVIASYKIATTIPTALSFIPSSVMIYVYPYFARNHADRNWVLKNYRNLLLGLGALNGVITAVLIVAAPLVTKVIFGEQYLDSVPCFRILLLSYFVSGTFRTVSGNLLVTQRKITFNMVIAISSSLLNTLLNVVMIQLWQSQGAAWATLLTAVFGSILNTAYLVRVFRRIPDSKDTELAP